MTHEDYMREAVKVARESEAEGGAAIGAIVVRGSEIVAQGKSLVWQHRDPSGHAESNCIRAACRALDLVDLAGCVMYGTLEPCGMCVSCAAWGNLPPYILVPIERMYQAMSTNYMTGVPKRLLAARTYPVVG